MSDRIFNNEQGEEIIAKLQAIKLSISTIILDATNAAKSWAVGGTGTRAGENTNNAMYYSTQSGSMAVASKSYAVGDTGERTGEDTDNSKYYSEQAGQAAQDAEDALDDLQDAIDAAFSDNAPTFFVDETDGNLYWDGGRFVWTVNPMDGNLYFELGV